MKRNDDLVFSRAASSQTSRHRSRRVIKSKGLLRPYKEPSEAKNAAPYHPTVDNKRHFLFVIYKESELFQKCICEEDEMDDGNEE